MVLGNQILLLGSVPPKHGTLPPTDGSQLEPMGAHGVGWVWEVLVKESQVSLDQVGPGGFACCLGTGSVVNIPLYCGSGDSSILWAHCQSPRQRPEAAADLQLSLSHHQGWGWDHHACLALWPCQRGGCPRIPFLSPDAMLLPPLPGSFPAQMAPISVGETV